MHISRFSHIFFAFPPNSRENPHIFFSFRTFFFVDDVITFCKKCAAAHKNVHRAKLHTFFFAAHNIISQNVAYYRRVRDDVYCYNKVPLPYRSTPYHPQSLLCHLFRRRCCIKGSTAVVNRRRIPPISVAIDVALPFLRPLLQLNSGIQHQSRWRIGG